MPESPSFAAWLRTAPEPWFRAFAAYRTDLLRTDVTDVARLAALAPSQAAVARGLESLDAPALRVVHRAAVLARIAPAVDRSELLAAAEAPAPPARGRPHLRDHGRTPVAGDEFGRPGRGLGVPRPAGGRCAAARHRSRSGDSPAVGVRSGSATARTARGVGRTAGERAGRRRRRSRLPCPHRRRRILRPRGLAAGERRRGQARCADPRPRRGNGHRHFALLVELASYLGWLSTTRDPADPQWRPTAEFDTAAASPREQVWTELVTAWLTHPVDIAHVLAGTTPAGERIHLLGRDEHARTAFGGFPSARPQILTLRRLVLVALLREGGGRALSEEDVVALLSFTHPLLAAVRTDEVAQVLDEAESFGLTASPLGHPDAHALTPIGRVLAEWIAAVDDPFDLLGSSPVNAQELASGPPAALREQIAALLPPLETAVTLQSDLTGVAFGPLDHTVSLRLERIADVDTRGQGTVYRFTDDSVTRALRTGESVESILAVLEDVSATEVPTTLEHLVHAAGARLHRIRVARARSVVVVDDPMDLDILLDDPVASAIGLRQARAHGRGRGCLLRPGERAVGDRGPSDPPDRPRRRGPGRHPRARPRPCRASHDADDPRAGCSDRGAHQRSRRCPSAVPAYWLPGQARDLPQCGTGPQPRGVARPQGRPAPPVPPAPPAPPVQQGRRGLGHYGRRGGGEYRHRRGRWAGCCRECGRRPADGARGTGRGRGGVGTGRRDPHDHRRDPADCAHGPAVGERRTRPGSHGRGEGSADIGGAHREGAALRQQGRRREHTRMTIDGHGDVTTRGPLIVQSDRTVLLESDHPDAAEAAIAIAPFAQLSKTPEHVHTYAITPLGLWNARASGHDAESVVDVLLDYTKHPVPHELLLDIVDVMDRWGVLSLSRSPVHGLILETTDTALFEHLLEQPDLAGKTGPRIDDFDRGRCTRRRGASSSTSCSSWDTPSRTGRAMSTVRRTRSHWHTRRMWRRSRVHVVAAAVSAAGGRHVPRR